VSRSYGPDWAAPPGAALEEWRAHRHLPRRELAALLGLSERGMAELVTGQTELTLDLVLKLQEVTGIPRRIWAVMEAVYQSDRARRELRSLDR
jgi:plasmid maintenance system antidote protein VapI